MNEYKIKPTKEQIEIMKEYWEKLQEIESKFSQQVYELEQKLEHEVGIKGIEFFSCDGSYVGIGNVDRTMKLIQQDKLEK
jgi:hypothetical protein